MTSTHTHTRQRTRLQPKRKGEGKADVHRTHLTLPPSPSPSPWWKHFLRRVVRDAVGVLFRFVCGFFLAASAFSLSKRLPFALSVAGCYAHTYKGEGRRSHALWEAEENGWGVTTPPSKRARMPPIGAFPEGKPSGDKALSPCKRRGWEEAVVVNPLRLACWFGAVPSPVRVSKETGTAVRRRGVGALFFLPFSFFLRRFLRWLWQVLFYSFCCSPRMVSSFSHCFPVSFSSFSDPPTP